MSFDTTLWERLKKEEVDSLELTRRQTLATAQHALSQYFADKRVKKVFLAGSILEKGKFYPFSDIDIGVDRIDVPYLKTLCELEELLGRDVDLIELKKSRLKDIIEEKGLRIK